ncbi:16S rRNA (cytidine1402-2'-O)-methyltransferase [Thermosulfidibacter takaii ABI70S6]|uniref:Ribosomal RNA small subunit methyltransferase I n=1 Tax=Thermosulfidibacter takaii (strain DSM 17441 / JCM 13301 / NBRC 103674 / ABI70S6) TaxID=1298851 RepID=A0A0S3QUZ1_THET7|nr:16S rRNA (cytidine(1402)-2'-O)-methyltransferase [Thermosulfidibacter takaii]BAT72124.1 16S rRNA (cytidine1402-2'-O)-methyltransferase [Thermosulfidibacter takaii ABI70S6]
MAGTLYIVSTPIGNLQDITFRALDTLKAVDLIVAEDTRRTQKLLSHFGIKKKMFSLYKPVEYKRVPAVIEQLRKGLDVALVSDAGTPLLSDPGYTLVREAINNGIKVVPIPGPSAILAALVGSGINPHPFAFYGFLPKKSQRQKFLKELKNKRETLIFFESPHRLVESLNDMLTILGDRNCCVAREITKMHEEFVRGSISQILEEIAKREVIGEVCIVVEGAKEEIYEWQIYAERLKEEGYTNKEIAKILHLLFGVPRKEIYTYLQR